QYSRRHGFLRASALGAFLYGTPRLPALFLKKSYTSSYCLWEIPKYQFPIFRQYSRRHGFLRASALGAYLYGTPRLPALFLKKSYTSSYCLWEIPKYQFPIFRQYSRRHGFLRASALGAYLYGTPRLPALFLKKSYTSSYCLWEIPKYQFPIFRQYSRRHGFLRASALGA
ncbi:MAG: hypothetical protein Q4D44_02555, partial [Eubacteriales bacterium]|nr:hypothetical protein [Eubacteriales bacterium]